MKERSEITHTGRAVFYTVLYPQFRQVALNLGYTLALHGSMASDMDLVAIPWIENVASELDLVQAISNCIGDTVWKGHHFKDPTQRPHNRVTYTLSIFSDWYIDLSIMKIYPTNKSPK